MRYSLSLFFVFIFPFWNKAQVVQQHFAQDINLIFCGQNDTIKKPVHYEWIQKDVHTIKLLNNLPANAATIKGVQKIIPGFLNDEDQSGFTDLGYGLRSVEHGVYGGYGSCYVDILYAGDAVLKLKIIVSNNQEVINKHLKPFMKLDYKCVDDHVVYEKLFEENITQYSRSYSRIFIESFDTLDKRREAINYFTNVLYYATFGEPFHIDYGLGEKTFDNLRYFIVNKDYPALEDILFSPSPTSRLFAARTLLYMQDKFGYVPPAQSAQRIKETIENAKPVSSGILSCWVGRFSYDYYDVVKDFELFLATK